MFIKSFFLIFFFNIVIAQVVGWEFQPKLQLDTKKNITYTDSNSRTMKTIFPVMIYSFYGWEESKEISDWNFLKKFGVNLVYSWDIFHQNIFVNHANRSNTLVLLDHSAYNKNSNFYSFPDEPIGAGTANFEELEKINRTLGSNVLKFINVDVGPYFYRKQKFSISNSNVFASKENCTWCAHGKGSDLSYDETVKFADIISFDYYPFRSDGIIANNVGDYGKTSVGRFTKLLKLQYPDKSIWSVIQSLWYDPFDDKYQGNLINHKIIRNLTFDAIINGADGISFFGHGQTKEYKTKKGYEFLLDKDYDIWKATLYQCYELGLLQQEYDSILLEDNLYEFSNESEGYSYCVKKVYNKKKYYFFVVNHLNKKAVFNVKYPIFLNINKVNVVKKIGKYDMPSMDDLWKLQNLDLTKEFKISLQNDRKLNISMDAYSVGIFSFLLN